MDDLHERYGDEDDGDDADGRYYDRDGKPIPYEQWGIYFSIVDYKRVALDMIGEWRVSTVWIGINHNWEPGGKPLIFETMVFGAELEPGVTLKMGEDKMVVPHAQDQYCERYSTEAAALAGHERVCALIREGGAEAVRKLSVS